MIFIKNHYKNIYIIFSNIIKNKIGKLMTY